MDGGGGKAKGTMEGGTVRPRASSYPPLLLAIFSGALARFDFAVAGNAARRKRLLRCANKVCLYTYVMSLFSLSTE